MLRYRPDLPRRVAFPAWSVGAKTRELNELLFEHGLNASAPDWLGITALHELARKGDVEKAAMVEFLLDRGAKPNLPDDPPWASPLAWARRRGHAEIAERLGRATQ